MGKTSGVNVSKIRGLMAEHNVTQEQVAKMLGISSVSFRQRMSGRASFKAEEIHMLSEYFKVSVSIFFTK